MSNIVMIFKQVDYVKLLEKYPKSGLVLLI